MYEFKPLENGAVIKRCSAVLANGCQCPRAGEYVAIADDGEDSEQQICNRCLTLIKANFPSSPIFYAKASPKDEPPVQASSVETTQLEEKEEVVENAGTTVTSGTGEVSSAGATGE